MAPSLSADFDGDATADTATAESERGGRALAVRNGASGKTASASAPAPAGDVVRVALTAAPLGSVGSLLEVLASTDASECLSVWRYQDGALTRLPIRAQRRPPAARLRAARRVDASLGARGARCTLVAGPRTHDRRRRPHAAPPRDLRLRRLLARPGSPALGHRRRRAPDPGVVRRALLLARRARPPVRPLRPDGLSGHSVSRDRGRSRTRNLHSAVCVAVGRAAPAGRVVLGRRHRAHRLPRRPRRREDRAREDPARRRRERADRSSGRRPGPRARHAATRPAGAGTARPATSSRRRPTRSPRST